VVFAQHPAGPGQGVFGQLPRLGIQPHLPKDGGQALAVLRALEWSRPFWPGRRWYSCRASPWALQAVPQQIRYRTASWVRSLRAGLLVSGSRASRWASRWGNSRAHPGQVDGGPRSPGDNGEPQRGGLRPGGSALPG
jgi:hypothetical protein